MKFVNNFKSFQKISESNESVSIVDEIVLTMQSFIDDGERVIFISPSGDMTYSDYSQNNEKSKKFLPVLKAGNKIISKFSIAYYPKNSSYDGLHDAMDNMKSTIGRLKQWGWILTDFQIKSKGSVGPKELEISWTQYTFQKPDEVLEEDFVPPTEDELRDKIESLGIAVRDIDIDESDIVVEFGSYAYDGELNSEEYYDKKFDQICDLFGFSYYDLHYSRARVTFEF